MKKFAAILAVIILCLSLSLTAFAGDWAFRESQDKVVVLGDGDAAIYKGETYTKIDFESGDKDVFINFSYGGFEREDIAVEDRELDKTREYFEAYIICDYILQTSYNQSHGMYEDYFEDCYVKDSHLSSVNEFIEGESIGGCEIEHNWGLDGYPITSDELSSWANEENKITLDGGDDFFYYDIDWAPLNETDRGGFFQRSMGMVVRKHDIVTDKYSYYALFYSEYERNCFYANGEFAFGVPGVETYLYPIFVGDEKKADDLTVFWDSMPEDDLDWIIGDISESHIAISLGILFVLLPLAGIVFAVIQLFFRKVEHTKVGYIVLLVAGAISIACYIIVLNMLM